MGAAVELWLGTFTAIGEAIEIEQRFIDLIQQLAGVQAISIFHPRTLGSSQTNWCHHLPPLKELTRR
ncbi:MAG: hypothetical protein GY821_07715 [Gammaproteobacteria bacterium]|nr:hypothetical protein [Gammaproteobacteria bacterium]